jgi:cyclic pyranopterin phosphate synthase
MGSLRLSVTDRCNMRCRYCMPEEEYRWLPRASILSFEELARITAVFASLGAGKVRLTGGEPLLRHDLPELVRKLAAVDGVRDLALTTNGILLGARAADLRSAGLGRVTVSLDTLRPERMTEFARSDRHADVLAGITAAASAGFDSVKLNSVVIRGYNDDEILSLLAFARAQKIELRYIEYMDVGAATRSCPSARSSPPSRRSTDRPSRCPPGRPRRRSASALPTAPSSASSPPPPPPSAATATAAASRPTAPGTSASMRPTASTSAT